MSFQHLHFSQFRKKQSFKQVNIVLPHMRANVLFVCLSLGPWLLSRLDAGLHCGKIAERFVFVPLTAIVLV